MQFVKITIAAAITSMALAACGCNGRTNKVIMAMNEEETFEACTVPNTLSESQMAAGWKLLFDGRTSSGWRSARAENFPEEGWTIADGMLQVWENNGAESLHGGDIITVDQYENFWL